jgi:hypothetical protein
MRFAAPEGTGRGLREEGKKGGLGIGLGNGSRETENGKKEGGGGNEVKEGWDGAR